MWYTEKLECFDCLAKKWLRYSGNRKWCDGKCYICWIEWKDIWLMDRKCYYEWECMIWDVFDWIEKGWNWFDENYDDTVNIVFNERKSKRKPIYSQSEECIDYVLFLIESVE